MLAIALLGTSFSEISGAAGPLVQYGRSSQVYAVTASNQLISFDSFRPQRIVSRVAITGLTAGETLVGIDFRPATDRLYGVGSTSQLYVIDLTSGLATRIGNPFTPALSGTEFGVDFNPAVDRIRVVSDTGQNLRLNPDTGVVVGIDAVLNYAVGDPPSVVGVAYTNSDNDPATGTTLYDIDSNRDILAIQNPPNNGTLNVVGPLGVDTGKVVGFDIGPPGYNPDGEALAALQTGVGPTSRLYNITLTTGFAREIGEIAAGEPVRGIAIVLNSSRYEQAYALTTANQLLGFDKYRPDVVNVRLTVTGLAAGENLVGIDFRPATGRLYGIGSTSRVYVINHYTGLAEPVGAPISPALSGTEFGVDFNPTVDRIRIVSDADQNLRVNPDTGVAVVDLPLNYAAADPNAGVNPSVVGVAYTNNDNNPATGTTLYDIDSNIDILAIQNPPNNGTLNTVGPLGVDTTNLVGFDIGSARSFGGSNANEALAALQTGGSLTSRLYSVNLATGATRDRGAIGGPGDTVRDIALPISFTMSRGRGY